MRYAMNAKTPLALGGLLSATLHAALLATLLGCHSQTPPPSGGALGYSARDDGSRQLRANVPSSSQYDGYGDDEASAYGETSPQERENREAYDYLEETPFLLTTQEPLSTFSIDVDTASYSNVRRFLNEGQLPPAGAVRVEELLNYFPYAYAQPEGEAPLALSTEAFDCPWQLEHRLMRVAMQARLRPAQERGAANLVFLLDVSGSMEAPDKLPLLVSSLSMLVQELDSRDRIALVVYAGQSGLVLDSTSADARETILQALERLRAGGSTNGGSGIRLAYEIARRHFVPDGINRVILGTDGDFNVGTSSQDELVRLVQQEAKSGVFLTVLGFGRGNLQDSTMEQISGKGNGHYAYIDSKLEARKVLVEELGATLEVVAKDVKLQVEFNPARVAAYRLIGYENRRLAARDFADDRKDAGEVGAGHRVTALYEIVPAGLESGLPQAEPLRYQQDRQLSGQALGDELCTLRLRYKLPREETSRLVTKSVLDRGASFGEASLDTRFATAVAAFGLVLRGSEFRGTATLAAVQRWASEAVGEDEGGYRGQFLELVQRARQLAN